MTRDDHQSREDRLIADYFRPLAHHAGAFALEDDAAALTPPPNCDFVLTKDAIVSGIHFFIDDGPGDIARKALRVNLSDLAAKGADPAGFLLALALADAADDAFLRAFADGLSADADAFHCPLLGGDTVRTDGPLMVSITCVGTVPHGRMVRRRGAQPGDRVVITGTIGDAALGLLLRQDAVWAETWGMSVADAQALVARYRVPQPRNTIAPVVRAHASAAMDVSDGFVGDLAKLCAVSGVSARIAASSIPLSGAARVAITRQPDLFETALTGGDDYEVLCTVPDAAWPAFQTAAAAAKVSVTSVGVIDEGTHAPVIEGEGGRPLAFGRTSFSHF
jgi:thiamine-monophosphate kinase